MANIVNLSDSPQPMEFEDTLLQSVQSETDDVVVDFKNRITLRIGECVVASRQLVTYIKNTFEETVALKSGLKVVAIEHNSVRSTGEKGKRIHALLETPEGRRYSIPSRIANTLNIFKDANGNC